MDRMRKTWMLIVAGGLMGCGAAPNPAPTVPATAPSTETLEAQTKDQPFAVRGLPDAPAAVPAAPEFCNVYAEHTSDATECGTDRAATLEALASALEIAEPQNRDAKLASIENCQAFAHGWVRALRADLAPVACGDVIVESLLAESTPENLRRDLRVPLIGLGLAARLSRTVVNPPRIDPPFDKKKFNKFTKEQLASWIRDQAAAIQDISTQGAKLSGYGRAIVAIEAGMADMRFVDAVRSIPLPAEMEKDPAIKDVYYGSLDGVLEPRKDRGRDAALVGLRDLASTGVLIDPRVNRARSLLSKLYGGRRIDALDGLLLPPIAEAKGTTVQQRLAAKLPTFYAGMLLSDADVNDATLLRCLIERGMPTSIMTQLDHSQVSEKTRRLHARLLVR
ncbi:MAG: hypothetical protein CSA75_03650, partial [Sorangium cellulosum]